jgi:hypothetical protein
MEAREARSAAGSGGEIGDTRSIRFWTAVSAAIYLSPVLDVEHHDVEPIDIK